MVGTKRAADEEATGPTTRSAKTAKTAPTGRGGRKGGKRGPKTNLAASAFKARAMPLHVNITHTPPPLPDAAEEGEDATAVATVDPGFIGAVTLVPDTFATGSYGWKGSKRLTIELQNVESAEGEKEKVHVMLTINATVMGSKGAKEEGVEEGADEHVENGAEAKEENGAELKAENGLENKDENGAEENNVEADITEAAQETAA